MNRRKFLKSAAIASGLIWVPKSFAQPMTMNDPAMLLNRTPVITSCTDITSGLVNWYPLAGDSSDHKGSLNATLTGSPSYGNGPLGTSNTALVLNGTSQYGQTSLVQGPQSAFSCTAWINLASLSGNSMVAAQYSASTNAYFQFAVLSGGTLFSRIQQAVDTIYINRTSNSSSIPATTWCHVAMTWNGGTTPTSIMSYLNGTQNDTTSGSGGSFTGAYSGTVALTIGRQQAGGAGQDFFNGSIAGVRIWNVALSGSQIATLYSNGVNCGIF